VEFQEPNWHPELKTKEGKWNVDFLEQLQQQREKESGKRIPLESLKRMVDRYQYNLTPEDILKSK